MKHAHTKSTRFLRTRFFLLAAAALVFASAFVLPAAAQEAGAPSAADEPDDLITFIGITLGGLGLIIWRIRHDRRRAAVAKWPEAKATIVSQEIDVVDVSSSDDHASDDRYDPKLRYHYRVGDRSYECREIALDAPRFDTRSAAEAYLAQNFPVGAAVPVFYDPSKPSDALLVLPAEGRSVFGSIIHYFIIGLGGLFVLAGLAGVAGALL